MAPADAGITTTQPGRTRRTAEERRAEVLQAAITEFSRHGYHGGSTETIAALAGISQPYVLRLFRTKKDLFIAAVADVCATIRTLWAQALATWRQQRDPATPPTVAGQLAAIGRAYYTLVDRVVELRLVLQAFAAAEDPDIRRQVQAELDTMFTWVREATGADEQAVRHFFATGMMLTVAASIGAGDVADHQAWARAYLQPTL